MEKGHQDLSQSSNEALDKLIKKLDKGCQKIFHQPGYMNSKGDAYYDFTCDSTHLCQICKTKCDAFKSELSKRYELKAKNMRIEQRLKKLEEFKKLYYSGGHGSDCKCQNNEICNKCVEVIEERVLKLEGGCGAEWLQNFGGMAAGPAYVICKDNYFLCQKCQEQLYYLSELNKQYKLQVKHLPQIERQYWASSTTPYYLNF